jgi:hypothetical protein
MSSVVYKDEDNKKVLDLKIDFKGRLIVLIGWQVIMIGVDGQPQLIHKFLEGKKWAYIQ